MNNFSSSGEDKFLNLLKFLSRLKESNIYFKLEYIREETIMVDVTVPGQRWEIEFFDDGSIKVERFASIRGIESSDILDELFDKFSDTD